VKPTTRLIRVAALCGVQFAFVSLACAAELTLPRDGWASWKVAAVDEAPAWCCFHWDDHEVTPMSCRLDRDNGGYGSRNKETTDTVRMYARMAGGKVDRLHAFAAGCPVEAATPIKEIEGVASDDSARWLIDLVRGNRAVGKSDDDTVEKALAALAMHRGRVAGDALAATARDGGKEVRKEAVFWLAQVRGAEGADITSSVMFNDKDPDVREHAAFSLSQTETPRAAADLIRLGNTDKDDEVRSQAWFWLAQTGAAGAETAIVAALKKDADEDVREQAIFALSQLPDERASRALIAAAEDKSLSREQRKQAVFWLSQSESDAALAYLDKVLERAGR
jgi:HEAT repeats